MLFTFVTRHNITSHINIAVAEDTDTTQEKCTAQPKDGIATQGIGAGSLECQLLFKVASSPQ